MSYLDKIKVGEAEYDIQDSGAARSTDVGNGTLTIQKNGTTVASFSANQATAQTANITVPTAPADINAQPTLTETQLTAVNSGITSTNVSQIATNASDIDTIEAKIPEQASASNQLADKNFVNSSIQTQTAHFRGNWSTWADVPTDSSLYPIDDDGNRAPTSNDYMVVQDASGYTAETLTGTWRFKYSGTWTTEGKNGWHPEYQVNETPLTAAQLAALNSGITDTAVTKLGGIEAGAEVNVQADWNETDTTADDYIKNKPTLPTNFTGTDGSTAGTNGLVPAPATTDAGKVLSADGTWQLPSGGVKTLTTADYNYPDNNPTEFRADLAEAGYYRIDPNSDEPFYLRESPFMSNKITLYPGDIFIKAGVANANNSRVLVLPRTGNASLQTGSNTRKNVIATVYDALNQTSTSAALSANQGRILNEKIGDLTTLTTTAQTSTVAAINELDSDLGGLKLVSISQTDYDALATKDPNTLYVITGA